LDQRTWEIRNKNDNQKFSTEVQLIYEIPEGTTKATLFCARPQMVSGDPAGAEISIPADGNPKALKKAGAAAPAGGAAVIAAPVAQPAVAKEQMAEEAFADALKMLEDGQNEKFAAKYIPKDKLDSLPKNAENRRKDIETLALAVRGKLQALKDKKPEMQEDGKAALFSDGDKNKVTFAKSGNSWVLRFKK